MPEDLERRQWERYLDGVAHYQYRQWGDESTLMAISGVLRRVIILFSVGSGGVHRHENLEPPRHWGCEVSGLPIILCHLRDYHYLPVRIDREGPWGWVLEGEDESCRGQVVVGGDIHPKDDQQRKHKKEKQEKEKEKEKQTQEKQEKAKQQKKQEETEEVREETKREYANSDNSDAMDLEAAVGALVEIESNDPTSGCISLFQQRSVVPMEVEVSAREVEEDGEQPMPSRTSFFSDGWWNLVSLSSVNSDHGMGMISGKRS